jgi:hypothetical protein
VQSKEHMGMQDARTIEDEAAPLKERGSPRSVQSKEQLGMQDARRSYEAAPLRERDSPWLVHIRLVRHGHKDLHELKAQDGQSLMSEDWL